MRLIGIDVGGTNFRLGVFSGLDLVLEKRFEADFAGLCGRADDPLAVIIATMASAIAEALDGFPDVAAIGLGFPGFIDPESGRLASSPNLPNLTDVDLVGPLSSRFGLPVRLENDALAAAYGESLSCRIGSLVYVGLGTGVGGGLILNGLPYPGEHGVAMEIGHIIVEPGGRTCGCGNSGCLEQYASASGVSKTYFELAGSRLPAKEIAIRADAADPAALAAFDLAANMLGAALSHILKVIDVTDVVIGGGMKDAWYLMEKAFLARLEADLIPVLRGKIHIVLSTTGDNAGMLGAAHLAAASR